MNAITPSARDEMRLTNDGQPSGWLLVLTKGFKERAVRRELERQGFEAYVPWRLLPAEIAKRRGVEAVPLFPRLVFARAGMDAYRWQAIFNTYGVTRVMCDPSRPRGVRPEFIDRLRREEVAGFISVGLRDPNKPAPPPPPKDPRRWVKLDDVVAGLLNEPVDDARKSVLVSLLLEGRSAVAVDLRK